MKVYVVFAEDHELHVKVVNAFCHFLQANLGFEVVIHIWEQQKVARHRDVYMMESFNKADKVGLKMLHHPHILGFIDIISQVLLISSEGTLPPTTPARGP